MKNVLLHIIPAALALMAASCAVEDSSTQGQEAQASLQQWLDINHPGVKAEASGIYILEETAGTGALWDAELPYSFITYTVRSLNGSVTANCEESMAKQLGTYVEGNYYGPRVQATGEDVSYAGVDALLEGMRLGGSRTAVVPAWLLTYSRYSSLQKYIDNCSSASSLIYTVTLYEQTDNLAQWEVNSIADYVAANYGAGIEPADYTSSEDGPDGTFYFITTAAGSEDRSTNGSFKLNYTGRLLNGQVFDTTNADEAKRAGIYDSSKSYAPASVTLTTDWSDISLGSSTSLINGFKGGLYLMKQVGEKATVVFTSYHGYSSNGSGSSIPPYAPLVFELELLAE